MHDYRHARNQPIALNLMATFEPTTGWSLIVHLATLSEHGTVSDRLRYQGLTNAELIDVIEATAHTRLGAV